MMKPKQIIIASDHAGFKLKELVKKFLQEKGYEVDDVGAYEYKEDDDYPILISKAAKKIADDKTVLSRAIIFGKSGEGEAIEANRFKGVRAAVYSGGEMEVVKLSRLHNDANVLSIGAGFVNEEDAKKAIQLWLETDFSAEERHIRRIKELDNLKTQ